MAARARERGPGGGEPDRGRRDPVLTVYVAGGSTEASLVASWIGLLRAAGVEVTHDWTPFVGAARAAGRRDEHLTDADQREQAHICLAGVRRCGLLWFIVPEQRSEGGAAEALAAHLLGRRVILSGPARRRSVFFALADEQYATHEAAFDAVLRAALGGGR